MLDEGLVRAVLSALVEVFCWGWSGFGRIFPAVGRWVFNDLFRAKRLLHPVFEGVLGFVVLISIVVAVGYLVAPAMA
ncbi:hypothetical protein IYR97_24685 (plasmid) [Pseudomonas fulva]|uniref:YggT family protein n=2 Tax=Pseudomonas putida group TaxID=136845 RepID=A0ABD7BML7_PSEPU|nr:MULTISPECIES: hypothetical protein [Pseudomonas putida group]EKT4532879.1 hypothetical protein [Pseudomonas putida]QOD01711.1 hypothetical protein ID616_31440 [Pseudomonas putida]QPH46982.1 hypothetical protein IYR97_24685 [Pseudomonas fulva]QPH52158.1 hypothetical protein IZU98_25140 [Pseudomonas fulva]